jgi:AmmeMemoRadiSam system protein A
MTKADPLVALARRAIEDYVKNGRLFQPIKAGRSDGLQPRQAGVFVSLHGPGGVLRGCIGTLGPTRPTLEEEIATNAVSAATRDPRFPPLEAHELDGLDVSVDVLGSPEEISDMRELDPRTYGLIVETADGRRALLLPDLKGVDTVEQQLAITCRKGGIDPLHDCFRMFRFRVERHH